MGFSICMHCVLANASHLEHGLIKNHILEDHSLVVNIGTCNSDRGRGANIEAILLTVSKTCPRY